MTYTRLGASLAAFALALALAACDNGEPSFWDHYNISVQPGLLQWFGDEATIVIEPERPEAGEWFHVTTNTLGLYFCTHASPSRVELGPDRAVIAVRDTIYEGPCEFLEGGAVRTDSVYFSEPGDKEIEIRGDAFAPGGSRRAVSVVLPVHVRGRSARSGGSPETSYARSVSASQHEGLRR